MPVLQARDLSRYRDAGCAGASLGGINPAASGADARASASAGDDLAIAAHGCGRSASATRWQVVAPAGAADSAVWRSAARNQRHGKRSQSDQQP